MKLSIVTVTLNRAAHLDATFRSLLAQTNRDWEYIVVDGWSHDNTVDLLRSYSEVLGPRLRWVSEPDNGIYDAMNKGIAMASGDAIGFIGSGDTYFDELSLQTISDTLERTQVDAVYGNLIFVNKRNVGKVCRYWHGSQYEPGIFNRGWQPAHPTFFCKKKCFEAYGCFDTELAVSADFDLMFRFLEKHRISSRYIPRTLVRMLSGGESNGSLRNIAIAHRNIYRAFRKYGYSVPPLYSLRRLMPKILNMAEAYFQF